VTDANHVAQKSDQFNYKTQQVAERFVWLRDFRRADHYFVQIFKVHKKVNSTKNDSLTLFIIEDFIIEGFIITNWT
jgi:hypothetical protein